MKLDLSALNNSQVEATLTRLHGEANRQIPKLIRHYLPQLPRFITGKGLKWDAAKADFYRDKYIPLDADQGLLLYLLARAVNAKRIVEFGTSFGISTIYLAAAVRDNGGGLVIGSELVAEKLRQARQNIAEAGLAEFVEVRAGDARETLRDAGGEPGGEIDLVLMDGFPDLNLEIIKMLAPAIRKGGIVVTDNIRTFPEALAPYVAFLRDPQNGFRSAMLALKAGTEVSVKV